MVYETFLQTVKQSVQERLGDDFIVSIRTVLKNNGVSLDGLCINPINTPISPTIYLNSYYTRHREGMALPDILDEIMGIYEEREGLSQGKVKDLIYFDGARDKIVYKLVNADENRKLLAEIPHYIFLDLALIFYLVIDENTRGQMTALVHNEHMDIWQTTKEQLLELAKKNTPRLLPAQISPMEDVLKQAAKENMGESYDEDLLDSLFEEEAPDLPLYVLSNRNGINGAGCLLYPEILKNFAKPLDRDLVILPSSIHEVLLAAYDEQISFEDLNYMVSAINETEVPLEDQLSNHIYYYSVKEDLITIPFNFSAPGGTGNLLQRLP